MNDLGRGSRPLFERLGGSPGISVLVEDIVGLHLENPTISARFCPYLEMPDKLQAVKQHLCAFLEAGSGGRAQYTGRSMRDAHRGMNINATEYMAAVDDIVTVLRKHSPASDCR
jgi:hemoglobin